MSVPTQPPEPHPAPIAGREVRAVVAAAVRLYREGVSLGLERCPGVCVVGEARDADETLAAVARGAPDVVLLDVSMHGALALVRGIHEARPDLKVVAFAVDDAHEDAVLACAEAGVSGWAGHDASLDDLVRSVVSAARGELLCSARVAALLSQRVAALAVGRAGAASPAQLTPREAEIGELISRGMSNKHIARTLSLRPATVKNHVHNILEKLNVNTRGEAGALLRDTDSAGWGTRS
ncbi:MAG: response regulator transcription factor [Longimicrobiaceae bacterium]